MKYLRQIFIFLLILFCINFPSLARSDSLEEIAKEISDIQKEIAEIKSSNIEEAIKIDKALSALDVVVTFATNSTLKGDFESAILALNFVEKSLSDVSSLVPKEYKSEKIEVGKEFSSEQMNEISAITKGINEKKEEKMKILVDGMMETNAQGLNTFEVVEELNTIGVETFKTEEVTKAIMKTEGIEIAPKAFSQDISKISEEISKSVTTKTAAQSLNRKRALSKELEDQQRFGSLLGENPAEVQLSLREVDVIMSGDPKKHRAFEIEKYGRLIGVSEATIAKGIQAIYSGDFETEKQITFEILEAANANPDWEVDMPTNEEMDAMLAETVAEDKVITEVLNSDVWKDFDNSQFQIGVTVIDVAGQRAALKARNTKLKEFADNLGNILSETGTIDQQKIKNVQATILNLTYSGYKNANDLAARVKAQLADDGSELALVELQNSQDVSLAAKAARVQAIMQDRGSEWVEASNMKEIKELTASEKSVMTAVYNNVLDINELAATATAIDELKSNTQIATRAAIQASSITAKEAELSAQNELAKSKLQLHLTLKRTTGATEFSNLKERELRNAYHNINNQLMKVQRQALIATEKVKKAQEALKISKNTMSSLGVSTEKIAQIETSSVKQQASALAANAAVSEAASKVTEQSVAAQKESAEAAQAAAAEASAKAAEQQAAQAAQSAAQAAEQAAQNAEKAAEQAAKSASEAAKQTAAKAAQEAAQQAAAQATAEAAQAAAAEAVKQAATQAATEAAQAAAAQAKVDAAQVAQTAAIEAAQAAVATAMASAEKAAEQAAISLKEETATATKHITALAAHTGSVEAYQQAVGMQQSLGSELAEVVKAAEAVGTAQAMKEAAEVISEVRAMAQQVENDVQAARVLATEAARAQQKEVQKEVMNIHNEIQAIRDSIYDENYNQKQEFLDKPIKERIAAYDKMKELKQKQNDVRLGKN